MTAIDVDFEVYKALTARRETESVTYNMVVRRLLGLDPRVAPAPQRQGMSMKGVYFPEGTQFRVTYKGKSYEASVKNGTWVGADGITQPSPSRAARAITGNNVNGWRFWSAKRPGETRWRRLDDCR
jgi:hypothetical protein